MRKLTLFAILLLLCTQSWGACTESWSNQSGYWANCTSCGVVQSSKPYSFTTCGGVSCDCPANTSSGAFVSNLEELQCNNGWSRFRVYRTNCTSQAEIDSSYCALNPTAEGCIVETDTTLFYCKNEYSLERQTWRSYVFKCGCKSANGEITGCNGKQVVDVASDCTPYKSYDGLCGQ